MMGKGSKYTTVQQSSNKPPAYAEGNLKKANEMAGKLVDNEDAWKPFQGSTVVDQSADTLKSFDMMRGTASGGVQGLSDAKNHAQGVINKGGFSQALNGAYDGLRGQAGANASQQTAGYNQFRGQAASTIGAQAGKYSEMGGGALDDFASGKMLSEGNPYLDRL